MCYIPRCRHLGAGQGSGRSLGPRLYVGMSPGESVAKGQHLGKMLLCLSTGTGEGMYEGTWKMLGAIMRGIGLLRSKPHPSATIRVTWSTRLTEYVSHRSKCGTSNLGCLLLDTSALEGHRCYPIRASVPPPDLHSMRLSWSECPPPLLTEQSAAQALGLSCSLQFSTEAPRNYLFSFWPGLQITSKNRGRMCGFSKSVPRTTNKWQ